MEGKGWGVLADEDIMPRTFVMEYLGEYIGRPGVPRCALPSHAWPVTLCTSASARTVSRLVYGELKIECRFCRRDRGCGRS